CVFVFFFFQAEDGIRDLYVTGVQTCALPISWRRQVPGRRSSGSRGGETPPCAGDAGSRARASRRIRAVPSLSASGCAWWSSPDEIGRASCRERVVIWVGGVCLRNKKHCR